MSVFQVKEMLELSKFNQSAIQELANASKITRLAMTDSIRTAEHSRKAMQEVTNAPKLYLREVAEAARKTKESQSAIQEFANASKMTRLAMTDSIRTAEHSRKAMQEVANVAKLYRLEVAEVTQTVNRLKSMIGMTQSESFKFSSMLSKVNSFILSANKVGSLNSITSFDFEKLRSNFATYSYEVDLSADDFHFGDLSSLANDTPDWDNLGLFERIRFYLENLSQERSIPAWIVIWLLTEFLSYFLGLCLDVICKPESPELRPRVIINIFNYTCVLQKSVLENRGVVFCESLVRSRPKKGAGQVRKVYPGEVVICKEKRKKWRKILWVDFDGIQEGWILNKNIQSFLPASHLCTENHCNRGLGEANDGT